MTTAASPGQGTPQRVPFWDNARFACVTLVVIGHGVQRLIADFDGALVLYLVIYAFHMPAFAIISGYFSKAGPPSVKALRRVLTDIVLPYVIMESIWTLVQFLVEGRSEFNPSQPSWTLWFLLALAIFRLVLPYLALLRWPLLISVVLSVGVGYFANVDSTFSLSRAIGILPFFVLGWKLREGALVDGWLRKPTGSTLIRIVAGLVLAGWTAVVVLHRDYFRDVDLRYWFFYSESYHGLGEDVWWAGLVRLALMTLAVLLSAAFLVLLPRGRNWTTALGRRTMYVYLLHSFVLYPIRESGFLQSDAADQWWVLPVVAFCIVLSAALATKPVMRLLRPIIEPRPSWLFKDGLPPRGGGPRADAGGRPADPATPRGD